MVNVNPSLLHNMKLEQNTVAPTKVERDLVSFQHPRDVVYTHDFISTEIAKFDLVNEGCHRCNLLCKHFQDPRSNFDKLSELGIKWVKHPQAVMCSPFPHLSIPIVKTGGTSAEKKTIK